MLLFFYIKTNKVFFVVVYFLLSKFNNCTKKLLTLFKIRKWRPFVIKITSATDIYKLNTFALIYYIHLIIFLEKLQYAKK